LKFREICERLYWLTQKSVPRPSAIEIAGKFSLGKRRRVTILTVSNIDCSRVLETVPSTWTGVGDEELREGYCAILFPALAEHCFDPTATYIRGPVEIRPNNASHGYDTAKLKVRRFRHFQHQSKELAAEAMDDNVGWLFNLIFPCMGNSLPDALAELSSQGSMPPAKQHAEAHKPIFVDEHWCMVLEPIGDPPTELLLPWSARIESVNCDKPGHAATDRHQTAIDESFHRKVPRLAKISVTVRTGLVGDIVDVEDSATNPLSTPPNRYPLNKGSFRRGVQQ
jgi:hypothetical protein